MNDFKSDSKENFTSFALQVLHGGAKPSLAALDRLLACLREPRPQPGTARTAAASSVKPSMWGVSTLCCSRTTPPRPMTRSHTRVRAHPSAAECGPRPHRCLSLGVAQAHAAKTGLNGGGGGGGVAAAALEQPDRGVWGSFTDKAIVLLEEAISMVRRTKP